MTPSFLVQSKLSRVRLQHHTPQPGSIYRTPARVDKRPWLAHAFNALLLVQRQGRNEEGIGDFRVTDETVNAAGQILGSIRFRSLPNPDVMVLSGGGIQIRWSNGPDAVEISIFPGEGVGVARLADDIPVKVVEMGPGDYEQLNDCLAEFA